MDAVESLPPESRTATLVLRIRAFIGHHLHDPDLTPGTIAAAHNISVSHLHRLLQGEDDTVAAFIRRARLDRVRRDLADPAWYATPLHDIAARSGFQNYVSFTRAFRTAYGLPPQQLPRTSPRR